MSSFDTHFFCDAVERESNRRLYKTMSEKTQIGVARDVEGVSKSRKQSQSRVSWDEPGGDGSGIRFGRSCDGGEMVT